MGDHGWGSRPMAFVPAEPASVRSGDAVLELRRTVDGDLVVLAFGTVEALVEGCGPDQPWICLPADGVPDLVRGAGADGVVWDAALEPAQRHRAGVGRG